MFDSSWNIPSFHRSILPCRPCRCLPVRRSAARNGPNPPADWKSPTAEAKLAIYPPRPLESSLAASGVAAGSPWPPRPKPPQPLSWRFLLGSAQPGPARATLATGCQAPPAAAPGPRSHHALGCRSRCCRARGRESTKCGATHLPGQGPWFRFSRFHRQNPRPDWRQDGWLPSSL